MWGGTPGCSNHQPEEQTIFMDSGESQLATEDIWPEKPINFLVCLGSSVSRQITKNFIQVSGLLSTKQDYNIQW